MLAGKGLEFLGSTVRKKKKKKKSLELVLLIINESFLTRVFVVRYICNYRSLLGLMGLKHFMFKTVLFLNYGYPHLIRVILVSI